MAINSVIRFLQAARNLAKQGMSKEQILDFARREFGKVSELLRKQIDDIYSRYKKPKTEKKGDVVPIKTEEGIVATDKAAEIVKKRTDDIAKGDPTGEIDEGIETLGTKMKNLKEAVEELKKTSQKTLPEDIMKEIMKGQKVMAENYKTGNIRTALRQFMRTEADAGRLKLRKWDDEALRVYGQTTESDPIQIFRRYYGEDALEAVDEIGDVFRQGESFKHYEELLRNSVDKKFLTPKTKGIGEYDPNVLTPQQENELRKQLLKEQDQKKMLEDWDPTDRTKNADGGIISNLHLNRTGFSKGSEFIGPTWESPKKSLDDIIGSIFGKREDRPDSGILLGAGAGPMGRPAGRRDDISSSIIQDTTANLAKAMLYGIKNYEKEDQQTLYSFMDNGIKLKINNQATGIETDAAEKFNLNVPTRIDDNTLFSVALDTYNKLPADLQAKIKASTNLAKDESWSALVEGNNLGITYNSDNQKIEGYYDVKLDSETLKPTTIRPKFEKDNINNETIHSMFIGHGDFPPEPPNRDDFPEGAMGGMMFQEAMKNYNMSFQAWSADKDKEYFGLDLVSRPNSDYKGFRTTFDTKNVSGWGAVESSPNFNLAQIEATGTIPNYLLKNVEPIELSTSLYKDLETKDKEAMIRADIPISDSLTPYIQSTRGDWGDDLKYGLNLDKTGQLGDWDYNVIGNIDQDKDYRLQADIGTDNVGIGGWFDQDNDYRLQADIGTDNVGVGGWYDSDGNWHAGVTASWKWGEPDKKSKTYSFNDPEEALKFAEKKKLFADGGLANILKIK